MEDNRRFIARALAIYCQIKSLTSQIRNRIGHNGSVPLLNAQDIIPYTLRLGSKIRVLSFICLCLILSTFCIISCGSDERKKVADKAVRDFHEKLNSRKYSEMYNDADTEFKSSISQPEAIAYFRSVNTKLGSVKQSALKSWEIKVAPGQTLVALFYETDFSEGKAWEEFIWSVHADQAVLFRYNINSPLLVTK